MMINWSRLLPRFAILVLLLIVLWWGRDPLIAWQIRSNVAKQTGAAAEVGAVRSDLASTQVVISNLRLYDPKRPEKRLFTAEKVTMQGNRADLLSRYLHFPEVAVEGIQMEVEGTEGGELVPDRLWSKFKERVPKELSAAEEFDWMVLLTEKPEDAAKTLLNQLETSRLVADLKTRWPKEVQQFEDAALRIRQRFQNVKTLTNKKEQNPDKLQLIQDILKELEEADLGIQELFNSVTRLRSKANQDVQAITEASQRDTARIKTIQAPAIDSNKLSETLVGPEIREQWEKTVAWGDWAASLLVPVHLGDAAAPVYERFGLKPPKRVRGENIPLTAFDIQPELLIDRVDLTGRVLFGTMPVYFNGAVRDIASPLHLGPSPAVAQFCFSGFGVPESPVKPETEDAATHQISQAIDPNVFPNLYVTLQIDRIGENEEDTMIVCCPIYQLPQRILGDSEKFAISVSPGTTRLDAVLQLQGEELHGEIRLIQSGIRLSPILPKKLESSPIQKSLEEALATIDEFEVGLLVAGTRSEPTYTVKSNLGDTIRPRLENVLLSQWNTLRQEMEKKVSAEAQQGLSALDSLIREQVDPVMQDVNTTRADWERQLAQLSDIPLDQLAQSQLDKLSAKDRQRLESFVQTPAVQAVLQNQRGQQQGTELDQAIQRGAEKVQEKLPGLLDKLRKL